MRFAVLLRKLVFTKEGWVMKRLKVFDGLRGLAAVVVMLFHVLTWTEVGHAANYQQSFLNISWKAWTVTPLKLLWSGNEAVILFYLIGGFVLVKPYLEGRELHFPSFFQKRFTRLVVPYWAVLTATLLCIAVFGEMKEGIVLSGSFDAKWAEVPSVAEVVGQFFVWDANLDVTAGAFWSIVQEWRISLVMPVVGILLYRYSTGRVVIGVLALNRILALLLEEAPSLHRTNYYFLYFLAGAVLCKHFDEICSWFRKHSWLGWLSLVLIPIQWVLMGVGVDIGRRQSLILTSIGFILLILWVVESKTLTRFFESAWLQFLGRISFSLYLTHSTFIVLFTTIFGQLFDPTTMLMVSPLFAIWFAWIWYERVEQGLLQLKILRTPLFAK
ncbi:acyltransferase family protein [Jeotgalibaca caeni]|uniref:acyltransferase family protein n=1 Tax=Jeotgalibaca caeni TaxID=3028623 RepID=UPI00237DC840|nr:acyltransferase [Jeotgalibaca caeni]MDE1548171.1 acyltransferase [Jeotgalibaca caeni]